MVTGGVSWFNTGKPHRYPTSGSSCLVALPYNAQFNTALAAFSSRLQFAPRAHACTAAQNQVALPQKTGRSMLSKLFVTDNAQFGDAQALGCG